MLKESGIKQRDVGDQPQDVGPLAIVVESPKEIGPWIDLVPTISSAAIALFTILAVHRLTRLRDREKSVIELQRTCLAAAKELRDAATRGWTTTSAAKRKDAVSEAVWQLQRIGALVEQMRLLSKRRKWLVTWKYMNAGRAVADLRDAITLDNLDDATRSQRPSEVPKVELAITTFGDALDQALFTWIS